MKSETHTQSLPYEKNYEEEPKQRFTGYWIPVELEKLDLNRQEQFLLSMIDSLDSGSPQHCFATNRYLAERCDLSESRISFYITKFRRMGLVEQVGTDGRKRFLKSVKYKWYEPRLSNKELCVKSRSLGTRNHVVGLRETTYHITKPIKQTDKLSCVEASPVAQPSTVGNQKIVKKDLKGKETTISKEDLFSECVLRKKDWTEPEIEKAWNVLEKYCDPVTDWFKFIEGTISKNRKTARIQQLKEMPECPVKNFKQPRSKKPSTTSNSETTEYATVGRHLAKLKLL